MNINAFIRLLLIKLFTPSPPKPPRKPSAFNLIIRKIITSTKFIIVTTFNALLLLAFLVFSTVWIYLTYQLFAENYPSLPFISGTNEFEEIAFEIFFVGAIVEILGIFIIYEKNEQRIKKILNILGQRISSVIRVVGLYDSYSKWVYRISKSYFNKILLPNIDLVEPGLINQNTSGFFNIIMYQDEAFKSPRQLRQIGDRYFGLLLLTLTIWIIVSSILVYLISRIFHLIFDQALEMMADMISGLMAIAWLLSFKVVYDIFINPNSILGMRLKVIADDISRLEREENLHKKIQEIEKDAGNVAKQYDELLEQKHQDFYGLLRELANKQEELQITEESIEAAIEFARNNPDAFRLILKENDELGEEREKKKYWPDKAVDIAIGIVIGMITTYAGNLILK